MSWKTRTARLRAAPFLNLKTPKRRTARRQPAPLSEAKGTAPPVRTARVRHGTGVTGGTGGGGCAGGVEVSSESESGSSIGGGVSSGGSLTGLRGAPDADRVKFSTRRPTRNSVSLPGTGARDKQSVPTKVQNRQASSSFKMSALRGGCWLRCGGQIGAKSGRRQSPHLHKPRASRSLPSGQPRAVLRTDNRLDP